MSNEILNLAREDTADFINDGGFLTEITFQNNGTPVVLKGQASTHHLGYDYDTGQKVNVKNAQITVNEFDLNEAGIITRDSLNRVNLKDHFVSYVNSAGITSNYVVIENFANETLGHIVCILGDSQ